MRVLLINGSPNEKGCTYTALSIIATTLQEEGIDTEIYHIGKKSVAPCMGCYACGEIARCVINDDVNTFVEYAKDFDGYVVGSPVYFAAPVGGVITFLNRAFFMDSMSGRNVFAHKFATAIVSARRAGSTAAIDQLNKYFLFKQMPIVSGRYVNIVYGETPDEVEQDKEGMQNMRIVARNMAYYLKCKEIATKAGIALPKQENIEFTSFIR